MKVKLLHLRIAGEADRYLSDVASRVIAVEPTPSTSPCMRGERWTPQCTWVSMFSLTVHTRVSHEAERLLVSPRAASASTARRGKERVRSVRFSGAVGLG